MEGTLVLHTFFVSCDLFVWLVGWFGLVCFGVFFFFNIFGCGPFLKY